MKIALIFLVVVVLGITIFWFNRDPAVAPGPENSSQPIYCTLDAKQCPDGSYVSRTGPNCEFAPCPTAKPSISFTPTPTRTPTLIPTPTPLPTPKTVIVTFANGTANPLNVEIKVGDMVKFVNNDNAQHRPASGVHPTHQICPGFDSLRGLNKGESYSFTFNEAKTCPWHDHLNPSLRGQVVVR